jgi:hypothetical protein
LEVIVANLFFPARGKEESLADRAGEGSRRWGQGRSDVTRENLE